MLAVLVLSAAAASGASAAGLPAFFHCVKQSGGKFEAECEKESAGGGSEKVEVSSAIPFNATSGEVTFEMGKGLRIVCKAGKDEGQISGAKTVGKVLVTLTGCEEASFKSACETGGTAGEIKLGELQGELGYTNKSTKTVGLLLRPASGETVASFSCPGDIIHNQIKGSFIGKVWQVNKMSKSGELQYRQESGKQEFTKFEGGATDVLEMEINESTFEKAAIARTDKVSYSAGVEVRA